MKGIDAVKILLRNGWTIDRIHGSHYVLKKGSMTEIIPVHAGRDLPKGLWEAIRKRHGL